MMAMRRKCVAEDFKLRIMGSENIHAQNDFSGRMKMIYVIRGKMNIVTEYDTYKVYQGSVVAINIGTRFSYGGVSEDIIVSEFDFPQSAFKLGTYDHIGYVWCNSAVEPQRDYSMLREAMTAILRRYLISQEKGYYFISGFYQIIQILEDSFLVGKEQIKGKISENEQRVSQIIDYIETNFTEEVSLAELSERLNLSVPYLSKFIKDNLGMTFSNYVNIMRLKYAGNQLLSTESSVTRIAMDSGFSNMRTFNKAFLDQFKTTPSEFRKKTSDLAAVKRKREMQEKKIFKEVEQILTKDDEKKASTLEYDFDSRALHCIGKSSTWNKIISIGSIAELKNGSVRKALITYGQKISAKYVRFWNIFTNEMNLGKCISDNDADYDYGYLDECLDFLIENDFIPYWHLAFIPKEFNMNQNIVEEVHIQYKSLDEIESAFRALIKHLLHRYSKNILNQWIFDLWYPQLYFKQIPEFIKAGGGIDYLEMMYKVIKEYLPQNKIGAANFSMVYGKENIRLEIQELIRRKITPDFISYIAYPYVFDKKNSRRWILFDEYIYKQMSDYWEIISETEWKDIPLWLTEFGLSAFQRNHLNDTRFRGSYIIATILQLIGSMETIGTYILNDSYLSAVDTSQMLFGGSGLTTKGGMLKPAFFAMNFLSGLEEYCIGKNKNCIVTSDGKDNYVLVCHNLGKLPVDILCDSENTVVQDVINDSTYEGTQKEFIFHIKGAEPGRYKVTENIVDSEHGDIMNWVMSNYMDAGLSTEEQMSLAVGVMPKMRISSEIVGKDGILTVRSCLAVNDFASYKIVRLEGTV